MEAHLVEVLRQRGHRMRVVRDVEHQRRLAGDDLKRPGSSTSAKPLRTACAVIGSTARIASNAPARPGH